jgi:hypothetical protein
MAESDYRLYVGRKQYYFASLELAKHAAKEFMSKKPELRIEILIKTTDSDFWAYEYGEKRWVPS